MLRRNSALRGAIVTVDEKKGAEARPRQSWMDLLRGLAILLVVAFHSVTILSRVDLAPPVWLKEITDFFALYRMPTLMFLSGLLLPQSLKKGTGSYFAGKLRSVWWPYLVWSAITAIVFARDVSSVQAIFSLLNAGSYLWFLYFIGLFYFFAYFVKSMNFAMIALAIFAVSIVVSLSSPGIAVHTRMFYLMTFFFLGAFIGRHWNHFLAVIDRRECLLAVPIAVAGGIAAAYFDFKSGPAFVLLTLAFVVAACHLSRKVGDRSWAHMPNFVGRNSLKFYVSHFPAIYLFDVMAVRLGMSNVDVIVPASICAALAVGLILSVASEKLAAVRLLFSVPKFGKVPAAPPVRT